MAASRPGIVFKILSGLQRSHYRPTETDREDAIAEYNKLLNDLKRLESVGKNGEKQTSDNGSKSRAALGNGSRSLDVIDDLRAENRNLHAEVQELKLRLSQVLGDKLTDGNAHITDISDPYRPVALADKFRTVYDDEWVQAYEDLDKLKITEPERLVILTDIIQEAEVFCTSAHQHMVDRINDLVFNDVTTVSLRSTERHDTRVAETRPAPNTSDKNTSKRLMKAYFKEMGHLSVPGLVELYDSLYLKKIKSSHRIAGNQEGINAYAEKVVHYIWRMQLADPPMALLWPKRGSTFNKELSAFYTTTGKCIEQSVWPTVLLHQGGNVIKRGVVIAK